MKNYRFVTGLLAGSLALVPAARGLDLHLQELPPAPGLAPSAALDPLEGLREALSCGLDFLGTAQRCGLSAPSEAASPFLVQLDPMFCRLTMRFQIGCGLSCLAHDPKAMRVSGAVPVPAAANPPGSSATAAPAARVWRRLNDSVIAPT